MVKSLLYSPEVLGGLSILTQGLAGKSPEVVMPSLMQGVQTASAMSKFEDEEDKKKFIEKYKSQVPENEMDLFLYDPELYIKNRVYTKPVKSDFTNFKDLVSGEVKMFDINSVEGKAKLKEFRNKEDANVIEVPGMDKSSDLDSKKSKGEIEKKLMTAYEARDLLENMDVLFESEFATYVGKTKAFVAAEAQKMGFETSQELNNFLARRAEWEASVNQYFDAYRKYVTGVAAGEKEIKLIQKSVPNRDDAPSVFRAKIKLQKIKNEQIIKRNEAYKELGIGEITRDGDNNPTGKYKEFLQKNKLTVTKEEAISLVTDLKAGGYSDKAINLKIRQIFGKENEDLVLQHLGLK
tara:strand:+ start:800 stop:1852 length:1053 start_codon:yes stop_codon:yes gene_type:complete